MGKSQREKGKRGERELAGRLRDHGYDCRRGQQFCGASGDADVTGLPGIHIECKRVERLNLQEAMEPVSYTHLDVYKRQIQMLLNEKNLKFIFR